MLDISYYANTALRVTLSTNEKKETQCQKV